MLPEQGATRSLCYLDDRRSVENDKILNRGQKLNPKTGHPHRQERKTRKKRNPAYTSAESR
jgi:hypothetical protein